VSELLRVFDRYEILRHLTTGGMGDIFLARQLGVAGFERLVILKSLRPELVEDDAQLAQFLNEARVVAQLNHPNIVAVLEVDEYRGVYFIAMEYIAGVDLSALLRAAHRARQRIPYRVSAGVILDAARGLAHAHRLVDRDGRASPLIHRDVSPQNVMVRVDGIAKVLDFGIATVAGHVPDGGRIQGKVRYMAPEQLLGRAIGPAADQFALGVTLWELCTQRRMFPDPDPTAIVRRMLAGPLPGPQSVQADVPPALDAIVRRMVTIDPARRFPSTTDVVDALRAFVEQSGGPAERATERIVGALAGPEIAARTHALEPTPVDIPGLLPAVEVACAACQQTNQRRHRYCIRCGAPLVAEDPRPTATPPRARPAVDLPNVTRTIARPSIHALLFEQASALRARQEAAASAAPTATRRLVVTWTRARGEPATAEPPTAEPPTAERATPLARHLHRQVLERVAALAEAFDARTLILRPTEAVLVLPGEQETTGGGSVRRALRFAGELDAELARRAATDGAASSSTTTLSRELIDLDAPPAARRQAAEAALAALRAVEGLGPGLFVAQSLTRELHDAARFGDNTGSLRRVEQLFGDTTPTRALHGRRDELAAVRAAVVEARDGTPRASYWFGEPGIGRSRLLAEAASTAAKRGFVIVKLVADGRTLGEQILAALGEPTLDDEATRLDRVHAIAARRPLWLGLDDADRAPDTLLDALAAIVSTPGPCVAVGLTAVSGPAPAWAVARPLAPLADDRLLAVAQAFADDRPLPPAVAQPLLERARGNPGRAEALVRALIASDALRLEDGRWVATPGLAQADLDAATAPLDRAVLAAAGPSGRRVLAALALHAEPLAAAALFARVADGDAEVGPSSAEALEARLTALRALARGPRGVAIEPDLARTLVAALEQDDAARVRAHEDLGRALLAEAGSGGSDGAAAGVLRALRHLLAGEARSDAIALALARGAAAGAPPEARPMLRDALDVLTRHLRSSPVMDAALLEAIAHDGRAAITAVARDDHADAVALATALSGLPQPDEGRHVWLLALAELALPEGRLDDARRRLVEATPLARDARARAQLAAAWAEVHELGGELRDAIDRAAEALEHAADAELPPDFTWRQSNMLGRLHLRTGDLARAEHLFEVALDAANAAGSARGRALAAINLATLAARGGQLPHAAERLATAIADAEAAGEVQALARALYNRGRILTELGRAAEARKALERCAPLARDAGWAEGEALARRALDALAARGA
jgi:tetratricopeptide (TPR) repeat protein